MTSKRRRAARAWMHDATERHKRSSAEASERAARLAAERTRADLTRMIPRDDENTIYPQGKIDKPVLMVMARPDLAPMTFDPKDFYARAEMWRFARAEQFVLRAQQFALVLPDGAKVVWWGWEMSR